MNVDRDGKGEEDSPSPAYPAMCPEARASAMSSATQRAPRAVLTIQAPFLR